MNDRIFGEAGSQMHLDGVGAGCHDRFSVRVARRRGGIFLDSPFHRTTPSALSMVASRYFLDAQPPLLFQEGTTLSSIETEKLSNSRVVNQLLELQYIMRFQLHRTPIRGANTV